MLVGMAFLKGARKDGVRPERIESVSSVSEELLGSMGKSRLHRQVELIGSVILSVLLNL